ncbi:MAG: lysophospholipid acyltransferase family protein [candidate division Zixibacteria bacterium]
MMKKIKYRLEYIALVTVLTVLSLLPYKLALKIGDIIAFLGFSVVRVRRNVTLENLRNSFRDKYSEKEYRKIGFNAYRNFAYSMIEYGMFPKFKKKGFPGSLTVEGEENLKSALEGGRGAVLITGHFGSWELMGAMLAERGWPIDYLVGEQHNLLVNDLMNSHRTMFGIGLIELGVAAKGVFKAVRKGRMVAMLSDQDAGSDGIIVRFLGRPASTPKGPAAFALKTGAPQICGFIVRSGEGQKVILEKDLGFKPSGDKEKDIRNLTQAYTSLLEKYIIDYPDHWFWPHRRWKTTT